MRIAQCSRSWMAEGRKWVGMFLAMVFLATGLEAIDLSCLLQPQGSPASYELVHCPGIPPKLTVQVKYKCEACGDPGPQRLISTTGFGECGSGVYCPPELQSVSYGFDSVRIWINEKELVNGDSCRVNGFAIGDKQCECPQCTTSPILISLDDGAFQLTGPEDGVSFDLDADGTPEQTAWTEADGDEAFLILDRNQNGLVDDGQELFGDATPQHITDPAERNGFEALAVFDDSLSGGNEDGLIDPEDEIFPNLQLWIDSNHNGISEEGELQSLNEAGVEAIDLSYRRSSRQDAHGNEFRYKSKVRMDRGVKIAWDVFFQHQPLDPASAVVATKNSARSRSSVPSCRQPKRQNNRVGLSSPR